MEIETVAAPITPDTGATGEQKTKTEVKQADPGASKTETPAERKHRLKFGKTEREVSEQELISLAQRGWASDEKFKSAAQKEREIKDALANGDVDYLIKKIKGKDQIEYAKEILKAELNKKRMTPDELEAAEHKAEIARLKDERNKLEGQKRKEKEDAAQRHYEEQWDKELSEAIVKNNLPKNKYVIGRAVKIASEVLDLTGNDPDWDLVVKEAKRQTTEEIVELFGQLEDYGVLGDDIPRKISKWLVGKGMSKTQADKEVSKVVKQADQKGEGIQPVDSEEYWERKRASWSK